MKAVTVLASGAIAAILACAASCIADLDPPATCPAEPQHPGGSCVDAIQPTPPLGCLTYDSEKATPEKVACLTGPREDCRCTSSECPPRDGACYPDGDCPEAVSARAAGASCKRLLPDDIGADLPAPSMCMCGCAGCAAVCDGVGPVVGVSTNEMAQPYPIFFEFGKRMPKRGRLGLYLRVRGLANVRVVLFKGESADLSKLDPIADPVYLVVNELSSEFSEQILYTDEFLGFHAYEWKTDADKPTVAAVYPSLNPKNPALALFELDCLVPFVVPL